MQIDIHIPRSWLIGLLLAGAFWTMHTALFADTSYEASVGGARQERVHAVADAEGESRKLRLRRAVLEHQEDILRSQLDALKRAKEKGYIGDSALKRAAEELRELIEDKYLAEQQLLAALEQLWRAQGGAAHFSRRTRVRPGGLKLAMWPANAERGVSAHFREHSYEQHFGIPHDGADFPLDQGTILVAADDGTVLSVDDNGYGFSSVTFESDTGLIYMYGHVSDIFVREGDRVFAGDTVAKSGGLPGTKGAGRLTTGPHLHMEVWVNGEHQDPLRYLPKHSNI